MSSKQKRYDSHFHDEWITDLKYNSRLRKYPQDRTKGCYILCMKVVPIARKGKGGLDKHAKSQKHRNRVPRDKQTLLTGNIRKITIDSKSNCTINEKASDTTNQSTNQSPNDLDYPRSFQSCLNSFIVNQAVTDAEFMWALEVVLKRYSLNSCSDKKYLFQAMFKDSNIGEKFTCGSTRCSYVINFDIALYFCSLLQDDPFCMCSFDECNSNVMNKGQTDMLVRYWDTSTNLQSLPKIVAK